MLEGEDGTAEAGEGISDADVIGGIGLGFRAAEVTKEFAKAGDSDLESAFGKTDRVIAVEKTGEALSPGAHVVLPEGVQEVILVTAEFPFGDMMDGEAGAVRAELVDDFLIGNVVIEQEVDFMANGLGKACDFAIACVTLSGFGRGWGGIGASLRWCGR